jgi:hypothetical protein
LAIQIEIQLTGMFYTNFKSIDLRELGKGTDL